MFAVLLLTTGVSACTVGPTTESPSVSSPEGRTATARPDPPPMPTSSNLPRGVPDATLEVAGVEGNRPRVGRAGDTTIVLDDTAVVGVDPDGAQLWKVREPSGGDIPSLEAVLDDDVVLITWRVSGDTPFPGRTALRAVDASTGRMLWRSDDESFVTSVAGRTYTSRCTPVQNATLGNCTVSARDPRTGTVVWEQPAYASARIDTVPATAAGTLQAPAGPDVLLVHGYVSGFDSGEFRAHDPKTGRPLGLDLAADDVQQGTGVVVTRGGLDDDAADGCRETLTAVDPTTQRQVWKRAWRTGVRTEDGKRECRTLSRDQLTPTLTAVELVGGRPSVVDLRTGTTVWAGDREGRVLAATDDTVVVALSTGGENSVFAVDPTSGEQQWTASARFGDRTSVDSGRLFTGDTYCDERAVTRVVDLGNGREQAAAPGCLTGAGKDWFATGDGTSITVYPLD